MAGAKKKKTKKKASTKWKYSVPRICTAGERSFYSQILAHDGEYPVSYIYRHEDIDTKPELLATLDEWIADLWASPSGALFAAGEDGVVHTYAEGTWSAADSGVSGNLTAIWGTDDDHLFVASDESIRSFSGGRWSAGVDGSEKAFTALRGFGPKDVLAVGVHGICYRFDGKTWKPIALPRPHTLNGLCTVGGTDVFGVGPEGGFLSRVGGKWRFDIAPGFETTDLFSIAPCGDKLVVTSERGIFAVEDGSWKLLTDALAYGPLACSKSSFLSATGLTVQRFSKKGALVGQYRFEV